MKLLKYTPTAFDRAERELRQAAARCLSVYGAGNSITAELSRFEDTFCGELPQIKQSFAPLSVLLIDIKGGAYRACRWFYG